MTYAQRMAAYAADAERLAREDRTLSPEALERLFPEKDEKSGGPC